MVAPVCEQNVTGRVVYFPERMKQLIFKNGIVEEGKVYEKGFSYVEMPMGTVHVFLREGYLFPVARGGKCVEDVGDRNGHVGVGVGKAVETPEAIRKGKEDAAKHLVTVPVNEVGSIPYDWNGQFGSASVLLKTAPEGTGIIAGGPARSVLELAGYKNIRTKSLGSNNKQNVVLATIKGLTEIKNPEDIARLRGKSVDEILN